MPSGRFTVGDWGAWGELLAWDGLVSERFSHPQHRLAMGTGQWWRSEHHLIRSSCLPCLLGDPRLNRSSVSWQLVHFHRVLFLETSISTLLWSDLVSVCHFLRKAFFKPWVTSSLGPCLCPQQERVPEPPSPQLAPGCVILQLFFGSFVISSSSVWKIPCSQGLCIVSPPACVLSAVQ